PYAISYVVIRNHEVIALTTQTTATDAAFDEDAVYSVVAVAESGALSDPVSSGVLTSLPEVTSALAVKAVFVNGSLQVNNLEEGSLVSVYSLNGVLLAQLRATAASHTFPVGISCIVRLTNEQSIFTRKVLR
ncbi:MAG: hypothetical protein PHU68_12665, partial [Paludibacter sp.]|nr:hypothetical protein [Paludibacter sp.]